MVLILPFKLLCSASISHFVRQVVPYQGDTVNETSSLIACRVKAASPGAVTSVSPDCPVCVTRCEKFEKCMFWGKSVHLFKYRPTAFFRLLALLTQRIPLEFASDNT